MTIIVLHMRRKLLLHQKLNLSFQQDVMAMVLRNAIHHLLLCQTNCFYCRSDTRIAYHIMSLSHSTQSVKGVVAVAGVLSGSRRLMRRQGRPVTAMDCARELI